MTEPGPAALDHALIAAHARGDTTALIGLYTEAADAADARGDTDAACFFLTHAYVFALEKRDPRADALRAVLRARGRED